MSNKMKKYFSVLFIFGFAAFLTAFEPQAKDFITDYQYELYNSWIRKWDFKINFPSVITREKISKQFQSKSKKSIHVEYLWKDWKIFEQREILPFSDFFKSPELGVYTSFLEDFVYRLNSDDFIFLEDFIDFSQISFLYSNQNDITALTSLFKNYQTDRFNVNKIESFSRKERFGVRIYSDEEDILEFLFPQSEILRQLLKEQKKIEAEKFIKPKPRKKEKGFPEIKTKIIPEIEDKIYKRPISELSLEEYISNYYEKKQTKELLHNKIKNVNSFLKKEFPNHHIQILGGKYFLTKPPFRDNFSADISCSEQETKDGINIVPDTYFEMSGKQVRLKTNDTIDLSDLTDEETENIAPFLAQLIYEHRTIGTRLLNFFLIHDGVPTTLVVNGKSRELYEIYSYANLLLMLNYFWKERNVYFDLQDVKKVNGYIEFKGYLIADDPQTETYDMAEIRYHLDKNYKIDLIMMFLYPETEK
ncbi:MAG TPA: hypothetical protein ENL20_02600 [Candidatus Cloacimonetes bacterium]|nr:hypothetical protein [Candidatus Cloacimonadota bacterium]